MQPALAVTGTGRDALVEEVPGENSLVDTSGTGGDASGTFNISTATALVTAGAGVRVAKHGNRGISSKCGSADVVEALGINIQLSPERAAQCLREARHLLSVCSESPSRDEAGSRRASRITDAHHVQPAWPADQSGARLRTSRRSVLARSGRETGGSSEHAGPASRSGRPWARWPGRNHDHGDNPRGGGSRRLVDPTKWNRKSSA